MTNSGKDVSNRFISRLLSVETVSSFVIMVFLLGATWSSLSANDDNHDEELKELNIKYVDMSDKVNTIQLDVATIKANQSNQADDIRRILDILQNRG